ncbi:hypothetical protein Tco_0375887 [Tanacetum coccineum]
MTDENVPALAPTRSDDQILLFAAWVPIRKSNYVLDLQKKQKNPNFQISVDILQNTNFFRAFTASTSPRSIGWLILRKALEITPIDQAHQFVSPPSGEGIMDFVNELGYIEVIHFVSRMAVNNLSQPWRAILSMINQCLTGKTSGHNRPRYPVLQMLWGIITSSNVDYAELMWEEFVQAIQTFLTDKANLGSPTKKGRKDKAYVIPYCRFTKLIICHLGRIHNIHQRSISLFHLAEEDLRLGNLKFVPKGEEDEVFGMPIPNELILNNIRNAPYYNAYLEMVAKHDRKVAAKKEGRKKTASTKQPKSKPAIEKSSKPAPAPKPKVTKEKPSKASTAKPPKPNHGKEKLTKATPLQKAGKGKVAKVRTVKNESGIVSGTKSKGKGKEKIIDEQVAHTLLDLNTPKKKSVADQYILQKRTPESAEPTGPSLQPEDEGITITNSETESDEIVTPVNKEKDASNKELIKINAGVQDEGQAGSNLGKQDEGQAGSNPRNAVEFQPQPKSVVHAGPNLEPMDLAVTDASTQQNPEKMDEEFTTTAYPSV